MPRGIYIRTKKQLEKLRKQGFQKGHPDYLTENVKRKMRKNAKINPNFGMKGKKHSEETKKIMGDIKIGKPSNVIGKHWKLSEETKRKMRGKIFSKKTRIKISKANKGEKSYRWKGGITSKNRLIRAGIKYRLWREAVFARDNWTCQKTGIRGRIKLHPHHIKNFSNFSELRFAIENGITFSEEAHREFHKKYGHKNNTKEQIKEFLA